MSEKRSCPRHPTVQIQGAPQYVVQQLWSRTEMSELKNQHYVPQFYLRNFSSDGRSIRLVSVHTGRYVQTAAIRKQCAKSFFYGKDGRLERELRDFEGAFAPAIQEIIRGGSISSPLLRQIIELFLAIQWRRTESAALEISDFLAEEERILGPEWAATINGTKTLKETAAAFATEQSYQLAYALFDLKAVILRAPQGAFITSDCPVVVCNPYWKPRFRGEGIGLSSSGIVITAPLCDHVAICLYDAGVYNVSCDARQQVHLGSGKDIAELRRLQVLNCEQNLYFSHATPEAAVQRSVARFSSERVSRRVHVEELVEVSEGRYVSVDKAGALSGPRRSIIHSAVVPKVGQASFRWLRRRCNPRVFDDGSAAGARRDPSWEIIYRDFVAGTKAGAIEPSDISAFARAHDAWQTVGPWKTARL